ncbi:9600_t:CDS:2, partial [Rhizophagus irregularis]
MQLKVRLQFHRSELRAKTLKIEPFSEGFFIILFYNESTFQYSPAQRKYICKFENWDSKRRRTGTCTYVLMQNAQQTYNITFIWKERIYKDSDTQLHCGSMRFEFNVDVRDFVE